jgi:hypothetical protein
MITFYEQVQKDDKARESLAFFSGSVPQINGQVFRYKRTD